MSDIAVAAKSILLESLPDVRPVVDYMLQHGGTAHVLADKKRIFVGSKLLKVSASDFSFRAFPTADTEKLTALVATCVAADNMKPYFAQKGFDRVECLFALGSLVAELIDTAAAAGIFLPYFRHIVGICRHALDIPSIINQLIPGVTLQGMQRHDRLQAIQSELQRRGLQILPPRDDGETSAVIVEVVFQNQISATYQGATTAAAYEAAVLQEARKIIAQATKYSRADGSTPQVTSTCKLVSMSSLDESQYQAHICWLLRNVRMILRFKNPYEEQLRAKNYYEQIIKSNGWVPLMVVVDLLVEAHKRLLNNIENSTEALIVEQLERHDSLQRFEVGECKVVDSPFYRLRCARALYAHELDLTTRPLFQNILKEWDAPQQCPPNAWALVDRKDVKAFGKKGFKLYDNCAFVTLVETKYLHIFAEYGCKPALQQFDEKIRNDNVFFLEVNMAAAFNDNDMTLKVHPPRGDDSGHFICFPSGPRYNFCRKKSVASDRADSRYFPMAFFTQRCCEVRNVAGGGDAASRVVFSTVPIAKDPVVNFAPGVLESLLEGSIAVATEASAEDLLEKAPVEAVRLDDSPLKEEILKFHQDPNRVQFILFIPKTTNSGAAFFARSFTMKAIKDQITTLGMVYRERSSSNSAQHDEFCITKQQAFPEIVLRDLEADLGVTFKKFSLLREAVTRECINKAENYERLEFIGDAILDWVVVFDAATTFSDFHRMSTVTTDVCRNDVLCQILPRSIHHHLVASYGEGLHSKAKADIFEAIVGALYQDHQGLDTIRKVISKLFQFIPEAFEAACPEERVVLTSAKRVCPYLSPSSMELLSARLFRCATIFSVPIESLEEDAPERVARPWETFTSHLASTGFPRIQDKDYATHFTTGTVYSYRRITKHQTRLHNKILALYHSKRIAFVNETLGNVVTLTFDVDGVNVFAFSVANIIRDWAKIRFPGHNSMGIVLDCTGMSVVTKKLKNSCHVHFPQICLTIDGLREATNDLRRFISKKFASEVRLGVTACPGQIVRSFQRLPKFIGRIVCSFPLIAQRCEKEGIEAADVVLFSFLSVLDVLQLTALSKQWRVTALQWLLHNIRNPPDYLKTAVSASCWKGEWNAETNPFGGLCRHLLVQPLKASEHAVEGGLKGWSLRPITITSLLVVSTREISLVREPPDVKEFLDDVKSQQRSITIKEKEFFDSIVKPLMEADNFGLPAWNKFIDHGLVESKKLRMYLCDKFDTVYNQEFRPLLQHSVMFHDDSAQIGGKSVVNVANEALPIQIPHASVLRVTSLQCPQFFDVYGRVYDAWGPSQPRKAKLESFQSITDPSRPAPVQSDWTLFTSAAMAIAPWNDAPRSDSKVVRHGAMFPAYWTFKRDAPTAPHGSACFHIGGQLYYATRGVEFASAVAAGMKEVSKVLVPHVDVVGEWRMPSSATPTFCPLFSELKGLRKIVVPNNTAAQQVQRTQTTLRVIEHNHSNAQHQMLDMSQRIRSQQRRFTFLSDGPVPLSDITHAVDQRTLGLAVPVLYVVSSGEAFMALCLRGLYVFHPANLPRPNVVFDVVCVAEGIEEKYWPRVLDSCSKSGYIIVQTKELRNRVRHMVPPPI